MLVQISSNQNGDSKSYTCKSPEKFYKYCDFLVTTFPKILQVSGIQPTVTMRNSEYSKS